MKYFQFDRTAGPKIIGVTSGASQVEVDEKEIIKDNIYTSFEKHFDYKNLNFWFEQEKIMDLKSPLIKGKLRKKAKVTDIMGYGPQYHCLFKIYSQKYINIVKLFNIGDCSLFDFEIENIKEKYYLMFIKTITTPEIIFDKSVLYTGHKILNNVNYFSVNNYGEFLTLLEKEPLVSYEKVAISKEFYGRDIISVQATAGHFYSEKLIDCLLDFGITGLSIKYNNSIQLEFV
ncbi:MAG: hypothetical protein RLZZ500_40 [Bacteroidota bacterium]